MAEIPYPRDDFHELSYDHFYDIFYQSFAPGEKQLKFLKNFPWLEKNDFMFHIGVGRDTIKIKSLFVSLSISQDLVSAWEKIFQKSGKL